MIHILDWGGFITEVDVLVRDFNTIKCMKWE